MLFQRIKRPPKLHKVVAQHIQEMILSDSLSPGTRIPSERVLCERFEVSRTVVREALKGLVARGLLKEVPGKGTFVWQNVAEPLKDLLSLFAARHGRNGYKNLFEARNLLEVEIAGLAAERAKSEDIASLQKINDHLARMNQRIGVWTDDKLRRYNELEFQFHLGLARSTHNELFVILLTALSGPFNESWSQLHNRPENRKGGVELHTKILDAVRSRDSRAARRATRENLKAFLRASAKLSVLD